MNHLTYLYVCILSVYGLRIRRFLQLFQLHSTHCRHSYIPVDRTTYIILQLFSHNVVLLIQLLGWFLVVVLTLMPCLFLTVSLIIPSVLQHCWSGIWNPSAAERKGFIKDILGTWAHIFQKFLGKSVKWMAVKTASEMTYCVSGGALNSTHSLTHSLTLRKILRKKANSENILYKISGKYLGKH